MEFKKSMSQKLRMDGRDYSRPGWCFVTLGADYHKHLFGSVINGEMPFCKSEHFGFQLFLNWRLPPV